MKAKEVRSDQQTEGEEKMTTKGRLREEEQSEEENDNEVVEVKTD